MQLKEPFAFAALVATLLAACGGDRRANGGTPADPARPAAAPASTPAPAAGSGRAALGEQEEGNGRVIEIRMITDEQGNRFDPNVVAAKEHDVLRFVLV